ncbi:MAG: glycosyltransferase family 4 protein [Oscillospiraceae bacterium]|nr:glycosyltransferase family 4 protein [Oscillospiraceae bacterium]
MECAGKNYKRVLIVTTTDSMIWNFLIPHIRQMMQMGFQVECACSKTGFYYDELAEKYSLCMHNIAFERNPFKLKNIQAYKKLSKLIKDSGVDWIQCHEPVGGALARLAGKRNKKYVMYFAHGFHFFKGAPLKHWLLYYTFEYILAFFTDCLITICEEDFRHSQRFLTKNKYIIPGIGVDFSKFESETPAEVRKSVRNELHIKEQEIALITVGELSKRKNQTVIIEALNRLNDNSVKLIICGEGDLADELKAQAARANLGDRVIFLGFRRDIARLLYGVDIFIFPSLWEGLGIAGIEAMHHGLPIIGANRQGIRDYVKDHETGLIFEPNDSKELTRELKWMIDNPTKRERLGKNGHDTVLRYSIKNSIDAITKIYRTEKIIDEE